MSIKNKFSSPPVIVLDNFELRRPEVFKVISEKIKSYDYKILDVEITHQLIPPGTNVVGLITTRLGDDPWVQKVEKSGCKVVRIGSFRRKEEDKKIPAILPDWLEAGRIAADHFADRQFHNVGFIGNTPWNSPPYLYKAFRKQAIERGIKCHLLQVKTPSIKKNLTPEKIFENRWKQILKWLGKVPKPIGILNVTDKQAAEVYTTVMYGKYEVPEEIALLGLGNNSLICDSLPVPLSSIDMNMEHHGETAVKLIDELIQGKNDSATSVFIPPKGIVIRQSTNLLAVPEQVTARALRFIWDHFDKQLSINDVAHATAVSRRKLTRKFRQFVGHGVNAEIRRKRLEKACELLRENKMNIAEIAIFTGFPSPTYFHKTFRKTYGITPGNYRKANS